MLAGYYTIASGMLTQQKRVNVLGNNIVNFKTPGFRAQRILTSPFSQMLEERMEWKNNGKIGPYTPINRVDEVDSLFNSGNLQETGRAYDMALGGEGFFVVEGQGRQPSYTRNGQFDIDSQGFLVLPKIGRVLSKTGNPIWVGGPDFTVEENGNIINNDGRFLGSLQISVPQNAKNMEKLEDGLYRAGNSVMHPAGADTQVIQKHLELSNVNLNREYTYLMAAQRAFQSCSSALQITDELNQKAASQIAGL